MRASTRTVIGKTQYVLERQPELMGDELVAAVWMTFYAHLFFFEGTGWRIGVYEAARLPGPERIIAAAKKLRKPKPPAPREAAVPYYARD